MPCSSRTRSPEAAAGTRPQDHGGHEGLNASLVKNRGRDDEERWPSKVTAYRLKARDTLEITVPNSGGYGDPVERDVDLVLSDVLDGFTTIERAERDYGVVIDADTMTVDAKATQRLRERRVPLVEA